MNITVAFLHGSYSKDSDIPTIIGKIPGDYLDTMTAADDESGFLSAVQKTGIAV